MEFNLAELEAQIPRASLASPTILTFCTRAPEQRVVENLDNIVPECFRNYYREGTFRVCAPRPPTAQAHLERHPRRRRKPQRQPPLRPKQDRAQAQVQPRSAPPKLQRARQDRLIFRSGVLDGTTRPDENVEPFSVWPRAAPRPPPTPPPGLSPPRQGRLASYRPPRPKRRAQPRVAQLTLAQTHPVQVAEQLRSVANLLAPRPTLAPPAPTTQILDMPSAHSSEGA